MVRSPDASFNAATGQYTHTLEVERKEDCLGCSLMDKVIDRVVDPKQKWSEFIEDLGTDPNLQFVKPSIRFPPFISVQPVQI